MSRQRRELPWVKVAKDYLFEGPDEQESLADLPWTMAWINYHDLYEDNV